jgi:hypothetical protein
MVIAPDLIGQSRQEAQGNLHALGITGVQVDTTPTPEPKPGTVVAQYPTAGSSVDLSIWHHFYLMVAALPPSPQDTGRTFAQEVAGSLLFSPVSYAVLTSNDGYVEKNSHQVPFGLALAIGVKSVKEKTRQRDLWIAVMQAVANNMDALQQQGFRYVFIALDEGKLPVMGFRLSDWKNLATRRQPQHPALGLITNKGIRFNPV